MVDYKVRRDPRYTDEELLQFLRDHAKLLDSTHVSARSFAEATDVSEATVTRHFGSWASFCKRAGLAPRYDRNAGRVEMFENLDRAWSALGRQPRAKEMKQPLSSISVSRYQKEFRKWTYHVTMRLRGRFIPRRAILAAVDSYVLVEANPTDKYLPSYLVLAREALDAFHVLFAVDVEANKRADRDGIPSEPRRLGARPQDEERKPMKCAVCGAQLRPTSSDLPFKIGVRAIVILRALPVLQCEGCTQYLIEDPVFARVEEILDRVGDDAELEVIRFAA